MPKGEVVVKKNDELLTPLARKMKDYVNAAFPGIYVVSHEPEDAIRELMELCKLRKWKLRLWDCDKGVYDAATGSILKGEAREQPEEALKYLDEVTAEKAKSEEAGHETHFLYVLRDFHHFTDHPTIQMMLQHQLSAGQRVRNIIIILSPTLKRTDGKPSLPIEVEKRFVVLEHGLPDRKSLRQIAMETALSPSDLPQNDGDWDRLLDASAGLTRMQAESAFALSVIQIDRIAPDAVWEIKANDLEKSGLLKLHRGGQSFKMLGGLKNLKSYALRALDYTRQRVSRAKGLMLVGLPGTGKSEFAKALGNETGRPTLILDIGALKEGIVGGTEENIRKALKIADAMAPCILFVDEIEKALAGAESSGETDSGVTAGLFGTLLTWLNDHTSDVYFIGTSNDLSKLNKASSGAFTRAGRVDATFFLDAPARAEKDTIWDIWQPYYKAKGERPNDTNWTGAEIRGCCHQADLLGCELIEAKDYIIPVSISAKDQIASLREQARDKFIDANNPGYYRIPEEAKPENEERPRRALERPSKGK